METTFLVQEVNGCSVVRLQSADGTNRLTRACVQNLTIAVEELAARTAPHPLIVTGNEKFFSAGADLHEIAQLTAVAAYEFSKAGQELMALIDGFPARIYAAISGYCMGGGLDLALACRYRIASPHSTFGHRGAALGLITGWGGTQRLPRLIGKGRALATFVAAEQISAAQALSVGLVDAITDDPVAESIQRAEAKRDR